ncbi:MAG: hypothetical protein ACYC67_21740 [Prosthecobacter sp.]
MHESSKQVLTALLVDKSIQSVLDALSSEGGLASDGAHVISINFTNAHQVWHWHPQIGDI